MGASVEAAGNIFERCLKILCKFSDLQRSDQQRFDSLM